MSFILNLYLFYFSQFISFLIKTSSNSFCCFFNFIADSSVGTYSFRLRKVHSTKEPPEAHFDQYRFNYSVKESIWRLFLRWCIGKLNWNLTDFGANWVNSKSVMTHQRSNSSHQDLTFHFRFLFSKYFSLVIAVIINPDLITKFDGK